MSFVREKRDKTRRSCQAGEAELERDKRKAVMVVLVALNFLEGAPPPIAPPNFGPTTESGRDDNALRVVGRCFEARIGHTIILEIFDTFIFLRIQVLLQLNHVLC